MKTRHRSLAAGLALLATAAQPALAANFVVTTNADSGTGSLRWALQQAALTPMTADTISFNLPANQLTISPLTDLPNAFYVTVDARTQPGYSGTPIVVIDGTQRGAGGVGLRVTGWGAIIGFSIVNFQQYGVYSGGGPTTPAITAGNYIGVMPDGVTAGPNGIGIDVTSTGSIIGGVGDQYRNVISGNTAAGIDLWTSANDIHISNNYIGTTADGLSALPNGTNGIHVRGTLNLIGDVNADERNIIAGNAGAGVYIEGDNNSVLGNWIGLNAAGNVLPNQHGVLTYGDGTRIGDGVQPAGGNVISGNTSSGIFGRFLDGLFIEANRIGTDPTGLLDRGNGVGIRIDASTNVAIGGASATYRNQISGNTEALYIEGTHSSGGSAISVQLNYVGTGTDGTTALGNDSAGRILSGDVVFSDNVIAGNTNYGLGVTGVNANPSFIDNRIGVGATDGKLSNGGYNIRVVRNRPGMVIGTPGHGNRIGASVRGIYLDPTSDGVIIQANFIGWIPDADTPGAAKDIGHQQTAIYGAGSNHQIGGDHFTKRNVISKNGSTGIHLGGSGHRIQGNLIGSDPAGVANIGNRNGIDLDGAVDVLVGGMLTFEPNYIRNNVDDGIRIRGQGVTVLTNYIYGNGALPIDLLGTEGIDANDAGDVDFGSNGLQNNPVIESASINGANTLIQGRLVSRPNANYKLQFFSSPTCGNSGLGQSQTLVGTTDVLTDGLGNVDIFYSGATASGFVTATATDALGNTSEFGNCVSIGTVSPGQFRLSQSGYWGFEIDGAAQFTVTRSGGSFGSANVTVTTQAQSALAGVDFTASTQTLSFAPGETVKMASIALNDDGIVEPYEDFLIKLSNPTGGATLGAITQSVVTVVSNDSGIVRVASSDIGVSEPGNGQAMAVFTVTMDDHDGNRTIHYATESGSATEGTDFIATSGDLVFATGETSKTISVPVKADAIMEVPEHFTIKLTETEADVGLASSYYYATIENTGGAPILFVDSFE